MIFLVELHRSSGALNRIRRRVKHLHWILLSSFFLTILLSVIVVGVLAFQNDIRNADRHTINLEDENTDTLTDSFNDNSTINLLAGALVTLNDFNPSNGLVYSIEFLSSNNPDVSRDETGMPVACFVADDLNYGGIAPYFVVNPADGILQTVTGSRSASSDGFLSRYPFDEYEVQLLIGAVAVFDPEGSFVSCDLNVTTTNAQDPVPFQAAVGQSPQGFSAKFKLERQPDAEDLNSFILTLHIRRDGIIKFFAVVMFIVIWLLTLVVIVATGQVIMYHTEPRFELVGASTALLFALPAIRNSQPGMPITPTLSDTIGYYWTIVLLGLSTFVLIWHSIWQLRKDRYLRRHAHLVDEIALPRTGSDLSAFKEKGFFSR